MEAKRYLFWDDETANSQQRICQVAFVVTDDKGHDLIEPIVQLINPESEFDYWNTHIHGIDQQDVVGKPTFAEFYRESGLDGLLCSCILVAHSAKNADLHHIRKSLAAYGIKMPEVLFVDTKQEAVNGGLPAKLEELCCHFKLELSCHHDALHDMLACRSLFWKLMERTEGIEAERYTDAPASSSKSHHRRVFSGLGFVHGSEETVEHVLEIMESKGQRANPFEIPSLEGLRVVVSGATPGYNRNAILAALKTAGVKTSSSVSRKTQYLAIGDNVGQKKIDDALVYGTKVITSGELLDALDRRS